MYLCIYLNNEVIYPLKTQDIIFSTNDSEVSEERVPFFNTFKDAIGWLLLNNFT